MSEEIMQVADQPPIKTPVCYTEHQIEVLQTLGKFTFVAHYETDDFLQKITHLLKKPDSTKINRLPTPWREKFPTFHSRVRGHRTVNAILVETRTISLKWWKPGQYAQNGGNQDNTVRFKY